MAILKLPMIIIKYSTQLGQIKVINHNINLAFDLCLSRVRYNNDATPVSFSIRGLFSTRTPLVFLDGVNLYLVTEKSNIQYNYNN